MRKKALDSLPLDTTHGKGDIESLQSLITSIEKKEVKRPAYAPQMAPRGWEEPTIS